MGSIQPEPLQLWRDARHQLDNALQQFTSASKSLKASLSRSSLESEQLDRIAMEIDQYLPNIMPMIEQLNRVRANLGSIRNRSVSLVRINKLPLEILLHILSFTVHALEPRTADASSSEKIQHQMLSTVTHVCALWRSHVVQASSFWSKVYLKYNSNMHLVDLCDRIRMCTKRIRSQPWILHFDGGPISSRPDLARIYTRLRACIGNLRELRLVNFRSHEMIRQFVTAWLTDGRPQSVDTLYIANTQSSASLALTNLPFSRDHIDSFALSIRKLWLHKICFDWDSPIYHNLTSLELSSLNISLCPKLDVIIGILVACPKLRSLRLYYMSFLHEGSNAVQPVTLSELCSLSLAGAEPCLLLPMLITPSRDLRVKLDLHPRASAAGSAVREYLSTNDPTKLHIRHPRNTEDLVEYLEAAPSLADLILELNLGPADTILSTLMTETSNEITLRCPKLCALTLAEGSLQNETVQKVISYYPHIQKLRLYCCFLEPFDEELLYWLQPRVKDVKCTTKVPWR